MQILVRRAPTPEVRELQERCSQSCTIFKRCTNAECLRAAPQFGRNTYISQPCDLMVARRRTLQVVPSRDTIKRWAMRVTEVAPKVIEHLYYFVHESRSLCMIERHNILRAIVATSLRRWTW